MMVAKLLLLITIGALCASAVDGAGHPHSHDVTAEGYECKKGSANEANSDITYYDFARIEKESKWWRPKTVIDAFPLGGTSADCSKACSAEAYCGAFEFERSSTYGDIETHERGLCSLFPAAMPLTSSSDEGVDVASNGEYGAAFFCIKAAVRVRQIAHVEIKGFYDHYLRGLEIWSNHTCFQTGPDVSKANNFLKGVWAPYKTRFKKYARYGNRKNADMDIKLKREYRTAQNIFAETKKQILEMRKAAVLKSNTCTESVQDLVRFMRR